MKLWNSVMALLLFVVAIVSLVAYFRTDELDCLVTYWGSILLANILAIEVNRK